ncbi:MAG: tripartite tricarboxylate transporter TctB family protein [Synergistaceae bacterium]|jgi:putative tricarboxylic transport membrane protein|nr:tripartite tricarboxylate transporter TctB family protein [Synergistaceae bacterium]
MRFNDALIGIFVILFGLGIVIHVQSYPTMSGGMPGPELFPTVIGVLLMIAGAVQIPTGLRSKAPLVRRLPEFNLRGVCNIVLVFVGVVFYIYASEYLGFLLTAFCIVYVLMLALRGKLFLSAIIAAGAAVFAYMLFNKLLMVPLPIGLFAF